ncbi:putative ketoacyl reductase [Enhygromyxa salina]|uniref:Putative ketoacyl reductase n=1 Tax=Enhygromyxa salina TaxID=215803 RepID=A0A2S9XYR6_9BACT|nr:oxidoreductase [Enhygromyxa salina]PRP97901.1 putative ketoacyl reductase [Enhygromyxa salina]
MAKWTHADIPDQTGKLAIVTGANSGIGFEAARALAGRGARVVLACRSVARAERAEAKILAEHGAAELVVMELDLADLDQVRSFAAAARERFERLDLLINNAGVMVPPASTTKQGFELQLGVNHLGHFALTGLVLELLCASPGARVVSVSSQAHRQGRMNFDDLDFEARGYDRMAAYGQSKLANLLFTSELGRRLAAAGLDVIAAAAHPGWTGTNLQQHWKLANLLNPLLGMAPAKGALPTLRAATDPGVKSGDYYGPRGLYQMWGYPKRVSRSRAARSEADARRLWEVSELRTGVHYPSAAALARGD